MSNYYDTSNPTGGGNILPLTPEVKQAHMAAIMNGQPIVGIASMTNLRNFPVTDCFQGRQVSLSYHTISTDNGGGIFIWDDSNTNGDNNGTIIKPTNYTGIGRWVRLESIFKPSFVNIVWFGARVNSVGFNNGPIINAAIQSLPLYASTNLVINGGYMRNGTCYIPGGTWYTDIGIVASGGMTLYGDGPAKTTIAMNVNAPGFTSATPKSILSASLSAVPNVSSYSYAMNLSVSNHGVPVGNLTTGWITGLSGFDSGYINSWQRVKAVAPDMLQVLFSGSGTYTLSSASIELDSLVVDFQIDPYNISMNNTFGSVCRDIQIIGNSGGGNLGSSGLYIAGAQQSYLYNVTVGGMGLRGAICDVAADKLWCSSSIKGPGYMCTAGPCIENGLIHSEHHNQNKSGTIYTMKLFDGTVVPRPAFYIRGATGWRARQCQGEDSSWEMIIDNCPKVTVDKFVVNGPGVTNRDGWETTMIYIRGDSYDFEFDKTFFFGTFKNLVNDQSLLSISQGENGIYDNFTKVRTRNGSLTYTPNASLLGPFTNDSSAAAKKVPIGAAYLKTDGTVVWRMS